MTKKVLIIYTGGTIGMRRSSKGYEPVEGFGPLLWTIFAPRELDDFPEYDLIEFEDLIDSANLMPADWTKLGFKIREDWDKYDGFVVLHGTDTMAYTASILSYMFQGLDKPIILTGSQIPLIELRNDAIDNLITSIILAANHPIPEVCLYFQGRLIRGNRSVKLKSTGLDAFDSPNYPLLAKVGIQIDIYKNNILKPSPQNFKTPIFKPEDVGVFQIYPGVSGQTLMAMIDAQKPKGLILQTYGVGNPPDRNTELMQTLEAACKDGLIIMNISLCPEGRVSQGAYRTGATFNDMGILSGYDMTLEAAFAKMHFLFAQNLSTTQIIENLQNPLCGEFSF